MMIINLFKSMEAIVVKKKILAVVFLILVVIGTLLFVLSVKKPVSKNKPSPSVTPTPNVVYIVLTPTPVPTASSSPALRRVVVPTRSVTLPVVSPSK